MQDSEIIDAVLIHLQGYIVESESIDAISEEENTSEETEEVIRNLQETTREEVVSDLTYDKKVSSEEILSFYTITTNYVLSYLNRTEIPVIINDGVEIPNPIVLDAIAMWTAGKIWQKYNVRVNNQEDETNILGYGDKLVIQAKEILKPFKYYKMMVY